MQREVDFCAAKRRRDCGKSTRQDAHPIHGDNPPVTTKVVTAPFTQRGHAPVASGVRLLVGQCWRRFFAVLRITVNKQGPRKPSPWRGRGTAERRWMRCQNFIQTIAERLPPLCKGKWHSVSCNGGIVTKWRGQTPPDGRRQSPSRGKAATAHFTQRGHAPAASIIRFIAFSTSSASLRSAPSPQGEGLRPPSAEYVCLWDDVGIVPYENTEEDSSLCSE